MKYFKQLLVISILLLLSVQTAFAQVALTILPGTDKSIEECETIISEYKTSGKLPKNISDETADKIDNAFISKDEAEESLNNAKAAQQAVVQEYIDAGCKDNYQVPLCSDIQKKEVDTKADLAEAQQAYNDADSSLNEASKEVEKSPDDLQNLLGCAITTGRISLSMIPYFIRYIINFMLGMSGIIATLFVVVGGYYYIYGGLTDQKEKGKKTIINALWGMSLAIVSWIIIQIILAALTS